MTQPSTCNTSTRRSPINEPWRYQRRISTLGPLPKRDPIYRQDWLEASRGEAIAGNLSIAALAVADVVADASNRHGADIYYLTQEQIAKRCRNAMGNTSRPAGQRAALPNFAELACSTGTTAPTANATTPSVASDSTADGKARASTGSRSPRNGS